MPNTIDPSLVSRSFQESIREQVQALDAPLRIVGLLANDDRAARVYAKYTRRGCENVGIDFELRECPRLQIEDEIKRINQDDSINGVIVYYPIFGIERDNYLKDLVDPRKDIEGLTTHWVQKLYGNERVDAQGNKAILPCTPLAIIKLLGVAGAMERASGAPLANKTVTVFNRSEVVGRPLASMLANDGAHVFSFDEYGPLEVNERGVQETTITRGEALEKSDIIITGVPSRRFELVNASEIPEGSVCLNFSTIRNFSDDAVEKASVFIPRVGPMTVTMVLRNALRLHSNYGNS